MVLLSVPQNFIQHLFNIHDIKIRSKSHFFSLLSLKGIPFVIRLLSVSLDYVYAYVLIADISKEKVIKQRAM